MVRVVDLALVLVFGDIFIPQSECFEEPVRVDLVFDRRQSITDLTS
jgi:hypothetical protein